jgi:histidine triad (HIT) family protein
MEPSCVFCNIVDRKIPAKVEYEDDQIIVFHDIRPTAPVHLLVVPKKHIPTLMDVEEADLPVISHIHKIAQQMYRQFNLQGMSMNNNCGEKGGQDVFHVHYHIKGWK